MPASQVFSGIGDPNGVVVGNPGDVYQDQTAKCWLNVAAPSTWVQIVTGVVSTQYVFVFRPGGVSAGNVFATFAEAYTALSAVSGERVLELDGSLGPLAIPPGTWNLTEVILRGAIALANPELRYTLAIDDGVVLVGLSRIESIWIACNATVAPVTVTAPDVARIFLVDASIEAFAAAPFFAFSCEAYLYLIDRSVLGAGPVLSVTAAALVEIYLFDASRVMAGAFSGSAESGSIAVIFESSAAKLDEQQAALPFPLTVTNETQTRITTSAVFAVNVAEAVFQEITRVEANGAALVDVGLPAIQSAGILLDTRYRQVIVKELSHADLLFAPTVGVRVVPAAGDTIDGSSAALVLRSAREAVTLVSDGVSNWSIASKVPGLSQVPFALASIAGSGTLEGGFNVAVTSAAEPGRYILTFIDPIPTGMLLVMSVTCTIDEAIALVCSGASLSSLQATVGVQLATTGAYHAPTRLYVTCFLVPGTAE